MKKLQFKTHINAPREKVWKTMFDDVTYRVWTQAFNPDSRVEGNWEEGSKMKFYGLDEKGNQGGMVSRIAKSIPNEYKSIEHIGIIKDGAEDTESEEARKFAPAFENYTFKDANGGTELLIEMDSSPEYEEMFNKMWPEALKSLKELCEK